MVKKYLYNTKIHNKYTQTPIYRLAVKLTPIQWNKVKEYFKYYNFKDLKGWGTIHPHDVIHTLLKDENKEYKELEIRIKQAKEDQRNCNGYLEAEEYSGLIFNLQQEQSKIIRKYLPH
jgi:hypothetical protein